MFRSLLCMLTMFALAFSPVVLLAGDKNKEQENPKVEKNDQAVKAEKGEKQNAEQVNAEKAKLAQDQAEKAKLAQAKAEKAKAEKVKGDAAKAEKKAKAEKAKAEKKPFGEKKPKADKAKKPKGANGVVKSVDTSTKMITITKTNKKQGTSEDVTLAISENATVVIQGEVKALSDVPTGKQARLMLSEDGKTVVSIQIGARKKKEKKPAA